MKNRILEICNELKNAGFPVTNVTVREKLGSGSMSTISPIVREFKKNSGSNSTDVQFIPDAPQWFDELGKQIWLKIDESISEQTRAIANEAKNRVLTAESERDEVLAEFDRMNDEISKLRETIEDLKHQNNGLKSMHDTTIIRVNKMESSNSKYKEENQQQRDEIIFLRSVIEKFTPNQPGKTAAEPAADPADPAEPTAEPAEPATDGLRETFDAMKEVYGPYKYEPTENPIVTAIVESIRAPKKPRTRNS